MKVSSCSISSASIPAPGKGKTRGQDVEELDEQARAAGVLMSGISSRDQVGTSQRSLFLRYRYG